MAKVKIKNQPSGLLNGRAWPAVGEVVDLPDVVVESMLAAGSVEAVKAEKTEKVEKRPASTENVETRKAPAKKAAPAAKSPKS